MSDMRGAYVGYLCVVGGKDLSAGCLTQATRGN